MSLIAIACGVLCGLAWLLLEPRRWLPLGVALAIFGGAVLAAMRMGGGRTKRSGGPVQPPAGRPPLPASARASIDPDAAARTDRASQIAQLQARIRARRGQRG